MSARSIAVRRVSPCALAVSTAAAAFAAGPAPARAAMEGIMFRTGGQTSGLNPKLYDLDPVTGAATNPRNVSVNDCVGIASSPAGVLYGLTDQLGRINNAAGQGGKGLLFTIDPASGAATAVGRLDPTGGDPLMEYEGDLAFNPVTGVLWGVTTRVNYATLFTIDTATGAGTVVANVPPVSPATNLDGSAIAFDRTGAMFLLDTTYPDNPGPARLTRVDPTTGTVLQSYPSTVTLGNAAGMAFAPDGTLYVADGDTGTTGNLYRYDFAANNLAVVGPTGAAGGIYAGLSGLTFTPVPEPTTLAAAAAVGLAALGGRRARRSR